MWSQTYCTVGVNTRPLHGDGDAVEEDDDQHDMVKHLVGDDLIAHDPEPDRQHRDIWYFSEFKTEIDQQCVKQVVQWVFGMIGRLIPRLLYYSLQSLSCFYDLCKYGKFS